MTMYRVRIKVIMLMIVSCLCLLPDALGQSARVAKPPKNAGEKLLYKAGDSSFIIGSARPDTLKGVLFGVVSDTGRNTTKRNFGALLLPRIDSVRIQRYLADTSVATQGSLLYDSVKKAPRFFDGKQWQTLSTARHPIYTNDDSLTSDRTVTNRGKKLVFTLDTTPEKRSSFSIGQKNPIYPVEIATTSYVKNKKGDNLGADSVALRISHNVMEGKTSYGLLLNERSNKATGQSAIGFMGGNDTADSLVKARIWAQVGQHLKGSKLGIDVADSGKILHNRMVIDSVGRIGMGTDKPTERLHIKRASTDNYIRIEAGDTGQHKSGIWLTERDRTYGWKLHNDAKSNNFHIATDSSGIRDTILNIKRNGATILTTRTPKVRQGTADSIALLIRHLNDEDYQTFYGLVLSEYSKKAYSRSALGFENVHANERNRTTGQPFMKARVWAQVGYIYKGSKFGIDVADSGKVLHTRMVIDSLGQVGMGTDKPTERLHIAYPSIDTSAVSNSNKRNLIRIDAPSANGGDAGIWLAEPNNRYGWKIRYNSHNTNQTEVQNGNTSLKVATAGNYFSIDYTTTNDSGNAAIRVGRQPEYTGSDTIVLLTVISPKRSIYYDKFAFRVHGHGQATQWSTYSDSIFKRNVRSMVGIRGRDIISGLRPVTYHMRSDTLQQRLNYGFIAQEVERVLPDIVQTSPVNIFPDIVDTTMDSIKSITYDALIAPLVANVQLLNEANAEMESKLSEKEAQINALSEALQQQINTIQAQQQQIEALQAQQQQTNTMQARQQALERKLNSLLEKTPTTQEIPHSDAVKRPPPPNTELAKPKTEARASFHLWMPPIRRMGASAFDLAP